MKGSDKNYRTDFEDAWRERLEQAEATPDPQAWENIDTALNKADLVKYKGYYRLYRALAAASIAITLLVTSWLYFRTDEGKATAELTERSTRGLLPSSSGNSTTLQRQQTSASIYQEHAYALQKSLQPQLPPASKYLQYAEISPFLKRITTQENNEILNKDLADLYTDKQSVAVQKNTGGSNEGSRSGTADALEANSAKSGKNIPANNSLAPAGENTGRYARSTPWQEASAPVNSARQTAVLTTGAILPDEKARALVSDFSDEVMQSIMAATNEMPLQKRVEDLQHQAYAHLSDQTEWFEKVAEASKNSRVFQPQLYANLNLNSEFFDPNFENSSTQGNALVNMLGFAEVPDGVVNRQMGIQNTPNASFTYGINLGVQFARHWIFEGGVAYSNLNTVTATNVTLADLQSNEVRPFTIQGAPGASGATMVDLSSRYRLNNSFEFASVPLRAGYVISVDRVNIIMKAGVATDIFISNEVSEPNSVFNTVRHSPGDESPFRQVFFNGTVGNEINYELNKHYSFSLEANYRFALNSFTRSDNQFSSVPDAYGIGMVFRYHFTN